MEEKQYGAPITYVHGPNLYVNVTNQCCNNCDFCLRKNSPGSLYADNLWYKGGEPTKEEMWQALCARDLNQYHEIVFCGYGEPACRWNDVMWLCDRLKEKGSYLTRMNTNGQGSLINGRDVTPELGGRLDTVSVSLNAPDADAYDAVCHSVYGKEAFPAILKFTAGAALNVPHVRMTVVSTMPQKDQEACRALCQRLGADFFVREYIGE